MQQITKLIEILKQSNLNKGVIELIILILTKTKKNATIEKINPEELKKIEIILQSLKIKYKISNKLEENKLIIGEDCDEIFNLEEDVFIKQDPNLSKRYAALMSYPKCCINKIIKNNKKNKVGYEYFTQNPWPWQLSNLEGLIWYTPCSPTCKESIEFGNKHFIIKKLVNPKITKKHFQNYMLHFQQNLYLYFTGEMLNNKIEITKIIHKNLNLHFENTDTHLDFEKEKIFLKKINESDTIEMKNNSIILIKEDSKIVFTREDPSIGCLIEFQ